MKEVRNIFTKEVVSSFIFHSTKIFTGPISLILIPYFLTKQMQGYWYSFISISALSILADLGFTVIVTQFSAHEFSKLKYDNDGLIVGENLEYNKLASLFRFVINRGLKVVWGAFLAIFIMGYYIMSSEEAQFQWIIPWAVFTVGSGIKFFNNLILSFFEGCTKIAIVQKIRYINTLMYFFINCGLLILNFSLYALAISTLICSGVLLLHTWIVFKVQIKQLMNDPIEKYNWSNELFSLLWRYAISWASGYLIFQLFTPLAFKNFGSVYAGKVGFTITLITSIFSIANIWIYVVNPKLNMLVAQKKWNELDQVFVKNMLISIGTFVLLSIFFLTAYATAYFYNLNVIERFLDIKNLCLLLFVWTIQLLINSLAVYSRAHKEEPYVLPSLSIGIYIAVTTFLASLFLPENFLFIGFYSSFIISLPWFTIIYKRRKAALHF